MLLNQKGAKVWQNGTFCTLPEKRNWTILEVHVYIYISLSIGTNFGAVAVHSLTKDLSDYAKLKMFKIFGGKLSNLCKYWKKLKYFCSTNGFVFQINISKNVCTVVGTFIKILAVMPCL